MRRILLVDDRPDDVIMARRVLQRIACDCGLVTAADGEEALQLLHDPAAGEFALVLLDIQMPKVDGLEVLRRIRADPRTADQVVVMLTSSSNESDRAAATALRAHMFVTKPMDMKAFEAQMQRVVTQFLSLTP